MGNLDLFHYHYYTPRTTKLLGGGGGGGGGVYWFHYVRPSVRPPVRPSVRPSRVRPASYVRSVAPTVLVGSISYLYMLPIIFRRCAACKISCKIAKFQFLAFF